MSILDKINLPQDLKSLSLNELEELCEDIASLIDTTIKEKGGHY